MRYVANQQPYQSSDADVEKNAQRHMICAEIDSAHSQKLEIDEQQQNVIHADFVLMKHVDEGGDACVDSDRANPKKRKVVKQLNPEVAETVRTSMKPNPHSICPFHTHIPPNAETG